MKRWIALLLCLCLSPLGVALAMDGAYLTGEEMSALEPKFEAFIEVLADTLVAKGLLSEAEREPWIYYQLGDFMQNGGFGAITIGYTAGGWGQEDDPVALRRFALETEVGTLYLDTLGRYEEAYSPLPGLPLDTEVLDAQGAAVACRFRWTATGGSFEKWDAAMGETVKVGITYTSDGEPLYWYETPVEGIDEVLTLDILSREEEGILASVALTVRAGDGYWTVEDMK